MQAFVVGLACLVSMLFGAGLALLFGRRFPRHAGAGKGATTVWQLRRQVEAEQARRTGGGRHHLREPPHDASTEDFGVAALVPPPLDVQQRVLQGLRRL